MNKLGVDYNKFLSIIFRRESDRYDSFYHEFFWVSICQFR